MFDSIPYALPHVGSSLPMQYLLVLPYRRLMYSHADENDEQGWQDPNYKQSTPSKVGEEGKDKEEGDCSKQIATSVSLLENTREETS